GGDRPPFRAAPFLLCKGLHLWVEIGHRGEGEPRARKTRQDRPAPLRAALRSPVFLNKFKDHWVHLSWAALRGLAQPEMGLLRCWRQIPLRRGVVLRAFSVGVQHHLVGGHRGQAAGQHRDRRGDALHRPAEL
ncbi:unnamed protein product, partial [Ixodes hexagonus]